MTRPALPATRDERIALARATLAEAIALADATLTGEHESPAEHPGCSCFTLQAGSFEVGVGITRRIAEALCAAGWSELTHGSPVGNHEVPQVGLYFHVPVGAP